MTDMQNAATIAVSKRMESSALKLLDDADSGMLTAYYSVFGNIDRTREIVQKGAFLEHLEDFLQSGWIDYNHGGHGHGMPVATPVSAVEDDVGLLVTAKFHSTPFAQEVRTMVRERLALGKDVKCSIGYHVLDDSYDENGVRVLKSLRLYEGSIVLNPANPRAGVVYAKATSSLLAGDGAMMPMNEHVEFVRAADAELLERLKSHFALRKKEGRRYSQATAERLRAIRTRHAEALAELDAMLSEIDEAERRVSDGQTAEKRAARHRELRERYYRLRAELLTQFV